MKIIQQNWKLQTKPINADIKEALIQQHYAAQFIALVGHYLIKQKNDDSNTNMEFIPNEDLLQGKVLPNGLQLSLHLSDLIISIRDKGNNIQMEISLDGKNKDQIFKELKQGLSDLGVNTASFINKLHYEIPSHQLGSGGKFTVKTKIHLIENSLYRHNANTVLNEIIYNKEHAESVRIWPHHFDTGSFIPVSQNEIGELSQSIGLGWAIPDNMIDEPYYYLSFWSKNPLNKSHKFKPLIAGLWMTPNWDGAVLRHSEILKKHTAREQDILVKSFFNTGISILLEHFKT